MPPRIPARPSLKAFTGSYSGFTHSHNAVVASSGPNQVRAGSSKTELRRKHDAFMVAHARQRKAANLSRQKLLKAERERSLGDPVTSNPTPFIQDIQATQTKFQIPSASTFNYFLKPDELDNALQYSKDLTEPFVNPDRSTADPQQEKEAAESHRQEHQHAQEAIRRIVNLNNGNTKDRIRLNIQKCIEQFGRHHTDSVLPPKPSAVSHEPGSVHAEKVPRVGPDTGSPEVQAAVLTVKIMNLSRHLETANTDRHNKRNLQLLVHKRQKLLKYIRKKERGGPRWQNLIETLGLSDAAWKGEIAL